MNIKQIKEKIKDKILQFGIVAATLAPMSASASNETAKADDGGVNQIERVDFKEVHDNSYFNEGDSIITNIKKTNFSKGR